MSNFTSKTIHYLRATRDGNLFNLQQMIIWSRKKKSSCKDSEVTLGSGEIVRIQHYRSKGGFTMLHLAAYIPGVKASTLSPKVPTSEDDEGTQSPPRGKEFKKSDCFLFLNEHHVLFCSHGIVKSKACLYLLQLFRECDFYDETNGFDLIPASNFDTLQLIQEHGVKSIHLVASTFNECFPNKNKRKNWAQKSIGAIKDQFKTMIINDHSLIEQKSLEDLLVNIEVKLDGNTRAIQGSQELIKKLAKGILDDDSPVTQYVIITQKNERITSEEICLQTSERVERTANSISHNSIWIAMENYFDKIKNMQLLEK